MVVGPKIQFLCTSGGGCGMVQWTRILIEILSMVLALR